MKKQQDDKAEQRRRDTKKDSLIVYGIPEEHEDASEQMKADFTTLKNLYSNRVDITTADLSYISRLGDHKEDKIRPIKITFSKIEIRLKY